MRYALLLLAAFAIWFLFLRTSPSPIAQSHESQNETVVATPESQGNKLNAPADKIVGSGTATSKDANARTPASQIKNQALFTALGADDLARRWTPLFDLAASAQDSDEASQKHLSYLQELMRSKNYLREAHEAFMRLKNRPEFGIEKAGLLEQLQQGNFNADELRELARGEMMAPVGEAVVAPKDAQSEQELNKSLSTDPSMILPLVAFDVFLKSTPNDEQRFRGTLDAVVRQPNLNVQTGIAEAYLSTNPSRREELRGTLKQMGVDLPK